MEVIGLILFVVGGTLALIGGIWLLVVAFQESVLWGLGCLLFSPISIVFVIMHWEEARTPFLVQLAGAVPMIIGMLMMGPTS